MTAMFGIDVLSGPVVASPGVADLAVHLALGDLYDYEEASSMLASAAAIAREMTGRSVGETKYRLSCQLRTAEHVVLPYPSTSCAVDAVRVDGASVPASSYELVQIGPWRALSWSSAPAGDRLEIEFTSGERIVTGTLRSLLLIVAADLYRSRESLVPGSASPASITAKWLASLERLVYAGPYMLAEVF